MKKLLAVLLFVPVLAMTGSAHAQKQPQGVTYDAQILKVTDGDTVVISAAIFLVFAMMSSAYAQNIL